MAPVHGPFEKRARPVYGLGVNDLPLLVYTQDALARGTDDEIVEKATAVGSRSRRYSRSVGFKASAAACIEQAQAHGVKLSRSKGA